MYKETDAVTAFMQYKMGGKGYILHDNGEIWPFKDSFKQFDNARFIVDFPDEKPEPEKAVVVPEVEIPEAALQIETPEKVRKKPGPKPGQKRKMPAKYDTEVEQKVLKAWAGEKSISEVCAITGYSETVVRRYLPVNVNG